jgi:hypothetical protein
MAGYLHNIEPFFGWLDMYNHEMDPNSPFHEAEHNQFYYDRSVNNIPAHPLWDFIDSESLLIKILFADYESGFAIIELFGEWNDLYDNDFKLLSENCLSYLIDCGINRFIFVCENVFNAYLDADDYYAAMQEELEDGWMCLLKARNTLIEEMSQYNISDYFFWNPAFDELPWRRMKPAEIFYLVEQSMRKILR